MKTFTAIFLVSFLTHTAFSEVVVIPKEEAPFVDEFSGKTIKMGGMAGKLIHSRLRHSPRVGETAPDFQLYSLKRKEFTTLSALRSKKPVVLIFSSWTCNVFMESTIGLAELAREFEDRVEFVFVYIREAHPGAGGFENIPDPLNDEERLEAARKFKAQTRFPIEILVDTHNDATATRWAAWPLRVYAVDTNGVVIYSGAQGPWGYRPYEGFLHGDGRWGDADLGFNKDTLESFLTKRYKTSPTRSTRGY